MKERFDAAKIIVRTAAATLVGIFIAMGLLFALLVTVNPDFAYSLYSSADNKRGMYIYASKLADGYEVRYVELGGDSAYNIETRLPGMWRAVEDADRYFGGDVPASVLERLERMLGDGDLDAYCAAVEEDYMRRTQASAHVYVTGEKSYLEGTYVRMLYASDPTAAREYATQGFYAWLDALASPAFDAVLPNGGIAEYLSCLLSGGGREGIAELYGAFRVVAAKDRSLIAAAKAAEGDKILPAWHAAKTCQQLFILFTRLDATLGDTSSAAEWGTVFETLKNRYADAFKTN